MAVKYGKGAKGKAIKLHSLVVRTRSEFKCDRCGVERGADRVNPRTKKVTKVSIQCAHIITRIQLATVTDERNAFSLCASCHWYFGKWPIEFALFMIEKHGSFDIYNALKDKVECGYVPDWDEEIERLTVLLEKYEAANRLSGEGA